MNFSESYLGIAFSIRDNDNGTCAWVAITPMDARYPERSSGTVTGGQNEAILAARKAIGLHLSSTAH